MTTVDSNSGTADSVAAVADPAHTADPAAADPARTADMPSAQSMDGRNELREHLAQSCTVMQQCISEHNGQIPAIGIILGSGLGVLADRIQDPLYIPFGDVPFMKRSTASSHAGRFAVGTLADSGKNVIAMQGRLHGYEGYTAQEVAYPVWLMHELGVRTIITTNAVGAINASYRVGDFCIIKDHVNLTGRNPVAGQDPEGIAPRFFSMLDAYDPALCELAHDVADEFGIAVQVGIYLGLLGPSFETPAEIRAFRTLGADTVAMSVCEEVIAARHVGMRVLGISLVSNLACGIQGASPDDEEVLEVAALRGEDFCRLITGIVARLDE